MNSQREPNRTLHRLKKEEPLSGWHGQLEQRCSSAVILVVVCVAGALSAVAPQKCGTRILMYIGAA